jgi:hypothetical protein
VSQRNKNNSIIFLTTLSVYLGLVLVGGASSPVLAQAAMTRQFDVKNEIEFNDDLDKNPNDEELKILSYSIENYFDELKAFIGDLEKLYSIEKFDLGYDTFTVSARRFTPCNFEGDPVLRRSEISEKINNRWLAPAINDAAFNTEGWDFLADCAASDKFKNHKSAKTSAIKINYDEAELVYEISVEKSSPQKAKLLSENLSRTLRLQEIDDDEIIVKKLYENTSFKSENNQVFVVTRLPRGSLDEFFKQDAKASK